MPLKYSFKALESLKYYLKPVLSCLLIKHLYFASHGSFAYKYVYQYLVPDLSD